MHVARLWKTFLLALILNTGIGALLFLAPVQALAAGRCEALFPQTQPATYGTLRSEFRARHHGRYTKEIPQSAIKNQCSLGTCHLHSWVSQLETSYRARTGRGIRLSTHYISLMHWYARTIRTLEADNMDVNTELGATIFGSRRVMLEWGLMPETAWTASRDFQSAPLSNRMTEYLRNIVARTKEQNRRNPSQRNANIDRAREEIAQAFDRFVGDWSAEFTYNNRRYTPKTFQQAFFPELANPIVLMNVNPSRRDPTRVTSTDHYTLVNTSINRIEATMRELIDKGLNIYLAYDHNSNFVSNRTGIMSVSAFNMPAEGRPLSRSQREAYSIRDGGHAVQVVGYDLGPNGEVLKWKVKNSWGTDSGQNGYYHMYNDYFRTFADSISFYRTDRIALPANETRAGDQLELDF